MVVGVIGDVFQALLNRNEHPGKLCAFHAYAETMPSTQEVVSKTNDTAQSSAHAIVKVDNVISKVEDMIVKKINDAAAHMLDTVVKKVVIPFLMTLFKSTVEGVASLVEGSKHSLMVGSSNIDCEDIVLASESGFSFSVAAGEHALVPASNRELNIISPPVTKGRSISIIVGCLIIGSAFFSGLIRKDEAQLCLAILQLVSISCSVASSSIASMMKPHVQVIIASVAGFVLKENETDELQLGSKSANDVDSNESAVSSLAAKSGLLRIVPTPELTGRESGVVLSNLSFGGDDKFDTLAKQTIPVKTCLVAFLMVMALASSSLGIVAALLVAGHTDSSSICIFIASLIVGAVTCIFYITLASSSGDSASTLNKVSLVSSDVNGLAKSTDDNIHTQSQTLAVSDKQQQVEADESQDSVVPFGLMHSLRALVSSGMQHVQRERGNLLVAFLFMVLAPLHLLMVVATTLLIASGNSWLVVQVVGVVPCLVSITSRIGKVLKYMAILLKGCLRQCLGCVSRFEPTTTISNAITDVYEAFIATLAILIIVPSICIIGVVLAIHWPNIRIMVQTLVVGWCMIHCSKSIFHQLLRLWHFQFSYAVDFFEEVTKSSGPLTNVVIQLFNWTSLAFAYFEDGQVEAAEATSCSPAIIIKRLTMSFAYITSQHVTKVKPLVETTSTSVARIPSRAKKLIIDTIPSLAMSAVIGTLQPLAVFLAVFYEIYEMSCCVVSFLAASGGLVCIAFVGTMISTVKVAMNLLCKCTAGITSSILKPIVAFSDTIFQVAQACTKISILVWSQVKSALQWLWRVVAFWPRFYWRLFGPSSHGRSMAEILLRSNPEHLSRPMRNDRAAWKTSLLQTIVHLAAGSIGCIKTSIVGLTATTEDSIRTCLANIQAYIFVMCSCIVGRTIAFKTAILCFVGACLGTVKSSTLAWGDMWNQRVQVYLSVYRATIIVLLQVLLMIATIIIKPVVAAKDVTVKVVRAIMKGFSSACFQVKSSLQWLWKVVIFWPRFYWRLLGPSSHGRSIMDILLLPTPMIYQGKSKRMMQLGRQHLTRRLICSSLQFLIALLD